MKPHTAKIGSNSWFINRDPTKTISTSHPLSRSLSLHTLVHRFAPFLHQQTFNRQRLQTLSRSLSRYTPTARDFTGTPQFYFHRFQKRSHVVSLSLSFSLPITYFEKSSLVVRAQGRLLTRINHEPLTRNKAAARASGLRHPSRAQTRRHTYNTLYVRIYVPSSMTAADFSHCPRKFGICRRRGGEYSRVSRCSRVPLSWDYGLSSGGGGGQYKGLARREYNAMMHFRHADKFAVYFPSRRECLRFMSSVCVCVYVLFLFVAVI